MVYDMDHSAARPPSCVLCTSSWRSSSNFTSRRVMMHEIRKRELACRMMVFLSRLTSLSGGGSSIVHETYRWSLSHFGESSRIWRLLVAC